VENIILAAEAKKGSENKNNENKDNKNKGNEIESSESEASASSILQLHSKRIRPALV
jgi:hypothetical protein